MKKLFKSILIVTCVSVILFICYLVFYKDNMIKVELVRCIDGDTAMFLIDGEETRVRFLAVNTPESVHPDKEIEDYGKESSDYTCKMLSSAKDIYLEYDSNSERKDKYDRVLAWIFVDGNNLSKLLVENGYASVNYIYGEYKYLDDLCTVQEIAYMEEYGIWSNNKDQYFNNYCVVNGKGD